MGWWLEFIFQTFQCNPTFAPEDVNIFRSQPQRNIKAFNPNYQVWRSRLKSFPNPSNIGFITYSARTIHIEELVKNILKVIEQDNAHKNQILIQSEEYLHTNEEIKEFYKTTTNITDTNIMITIIKVFPQYTATPDSSAFFPFTSLEPSSAL